MRLLLEAQRTGFEGLIPFEAESAVIAKAHLATIVGAAIKAREDHKALHHRETAYLRELRESIRHYALDEVSPELKEQIKKEQERTSLQNFPYPSTKLDFYGLELDLEDFEYDFDGIRGFVTDPNIVSVDEFFTNYKELTG